MSKKQLRTGPLVAATVSAVAAFGLYALDLFGLTVPASIETYRTPAAIGFAVLALVLMLLSSLMGRPAVEVDLTDVITDDMSPRERKAAIKEATERARADAEFRAEAVKQARKAEKANAKAARRTKRSEPTEDDSPDVAIPQEDNLTPQEWLQSLRDESDTTDKVFDITGMDTQGATEVETPRVMSPMFTDDEVEAEPEWLYETLVDPDFVVPFTDEPTDEATGETEEVVDEPTLDLADVDPAPEVDESEISEFDDVAEEVAKEMTEDDFAALSDEPDDFEDPDTRYWYWPSKDVFVSVDAIAVPLEIDSVEGDVSELENVSLAVESITEQSQYLADVVRSLAERVEAGSETLAAVEAERDAAKCSADLSQRNAEELRATLTDAVEAHKETISRLEAELAEARAAAERAAADAEAAREAAEAASVDEATRAALAAAQEDNEILSAAVAELEKNLDQMVAAQAKIQSAAAATERARFAARSNAVRDALVEENVSDEVMLKVLRILVDGLKASEATDGQ